MAKKPSADAMLDNVMLNDTAARGSTGTHSCPTRLRRCKLTPLIGAVAVGGLSRTQ